MDEQTDNLMLVMLRRIDDRTDRMAADIHDIKVCMSNVEEGLAGVNRRIDRLEERVDRIERRLEIVNLH